ALRDLGRADLSKRPWLEEIDNIFSRVPFDTTLRFVPEVAAMVREGAIPSSRSYYVDLCKTALLLVEHLGITADEFGNRETLSFVVNMENVFQEYCFVVLRDASLQQGRQIYTARPPESVRKL